MYRQAARRLASGASRSALRLFPTAVILTYHRVADASIDPQLLCVTPSHFSEHLRVLRDHGACLSLRELVRGCAVGRLPHRGIVVTFDDGYADNLLNVAPLLERAGVPATVFVSTGGLEAGLPFWWDELEMLLLEDRPLPSQLSIEAHSRRLHWDMRVPAGGASAAPWDITQSLDPTPRHAAYRAMHALCREMSASEREDVMSQLRRQIGDSAALNRNRRLTAEQVGKLAQSDAVEVGAHGVTHSSFRTLGTTDSRREMWDSKRRLTELAEREIDLFSYPFGARGDLSSSTPGLVRDCGFMAACANWPGPTWWRTNPYLLPRYLVRDWTASDFARILEEWFSGAS